VIGGLFEKSRGLYPNLYPSQWFSNQGFTQHGFRSVKAAVRTSLTLIVGPKTWRQLRGSSRLSGRTSGGRPEMSEMINCEQNGTTGPSRARGLPCPIRTMGILV